MNTLIVPQNDDPVQPESTPLKPIKRELLLHERPLLLLPALAVEYGVEKAVMLQQLHYLSKLPNYGRMIDGERWIRMTAPEWKDQFPFWSVRVIGKLLIDLEAIGAIKSGVFNAKITDRSKWYSLCIEQPNARLPALPDITPFGDMGNGKKSEQPNARLPALPDITPFGDMYNTSIKTLESFTEKKTEINTAASSEADSESSDSTPPIIQHIANLRAGKSDLTKRDSYYLLSEVIAHQAYHMKAGGKWTETTTRAVLKDQFGAADKGSIAQRSALIIDVWDMYVWWEADPTHTLSAPVRAQTVLSALHKYRTRTVEKKAEVKPADSGLVEWGELKDGTKRPRQPNEPLTKFVKTWFAPRGKE